MLTCLHLVRKSSSKAVKKKYVWTQLGLSQTITKGHKIYYWTLVFIEIVGLVHIYGHSLLSSDAGI